MKLESFVAKYFVPLTVISLGAIFLGDILTPRGYGVALLYVIPLLFTSFFSTPSPRLVVGPIILLLLFAGFMKPPFIPVAAFVFFKIAILSVLICVAFVLEQRRRIERDLRRSEALQRTIFAALPIASGVVVSRRLAIVNDWMIKMLGYAGEEMTGRNSRFLYASQEDYEYVGEVMYSEVKNTGRSIKELKWLHKDGALIDVLLSLTAVDKYDLGKGVIFAGVDITQRKKAERELLHQKQTFEALAEYSPDMIILYDRDKRYQYVNKTVTRYTGLTTGHFIGKHAPLLPASTEVRAVFLRKIDETIATGKSTSFEAHFSSVDGAKTFVNTYLPVLSGNGQVESVIGFMHDITDFKNIQAMLERRAAEAEESKRLLDALMENVPEGIAIATAPDVEMKMVSRYGLEMRGGAPEELLGIGYVEHSKRWQICYPDGSLVPGDKLPLTLAVREGKMTVSQELRIRTADGRLVPILALAAPIRDKQGRITAGVAAWRDISKLKQAEEVLKRDKETFERLVMERTKELISAQLELEQSKRLSDIGSLAATVAHELRNPLGVIRTAAYNIKRKAGEAPIAGQLENIDKKIIQSDQIINNLLFYARLKKPHFEPVRIYQIIQESIDSFGRRFPDFSLEERLDQVKGLVIEADPTQMLEMFNNIISNAHDAVREKQREGVVRISGSRTDNAVIFVFEDNGVGIAEADLSRIFEPFFTNKAKGTGLGLTVTRQIVSLHSGTINIKSEKGKGTTVTVILPVTQSNPSR